MTIGLVCDQGLNKRNIQRAAKKNGHRHDTGAARGRINFGTERRERERRGGKDQGVRSENPIARRFSLRPAYFSRVESAIDTEGRSRLLCETLRSLVLRVARQPDDFDGDVVTASAVDVACCLR